MQVKGTDRAPHVGLTVNDARGLLFDRDTVAFYGDPAWQARLAGGPRAWEQSLSRKANRYVFEILPRRGTNSFEPVNRNGSQRGGRPFVQFFPERVGDIRIVSRIFNHRTVSSVILFPAFPESDAGLRFQGKGDINRGRSTAQQGLSRPFGGG